MKKTILALGCALATAPALADDVFTVDLTTTNTAIGVTESDNFGFSDVQSVFDQINANELETAFEHYDAVASTARANIGYRGLPMVFSYPTAGSTELVFEVPSLAIHRSFTGATRDASADQLEEFLKSEGAGLLNRIQKSLIAKSPVDPIAGNPSSLMGTLVAGQFESGFMDQTSNIQPVSAAAAAAGASSETVEQDNLIALGARFGRFTADGKNSNVVTLPLGYSFRPDGGRLKSVDVSLPITVADVEGAKSGNAALGVGLTFGINDRWSLTPAVGAGLVGSEDLGSAGAVGSGSLTSAYTIPMDGYSLNIGNMVGYFETLAFSYGDYDFNPGVANTVLRNGIMASVPGTFRGKDVATEYWAVDTRYLGDDLYSEFYDEIGISFGFAKTEERRLENYLRVGASYLWGDGVSGFKLNIGYTF